MKRLVKSRSWFELLTTAGGFYTRLARGCGVRFLGDIFLFVGTLISLRFMAGTILRFMAGTSLLAAWEFF